MHGTGMVNSTISSESADFYITRTWPGLGFTSFQYWMSHFFDTLVEFLGYSPLYTQFKLVHKINSYYLSSASKKML